MDTSTCQQARLNAGQAPNNSNEAKIAVAALTVVKFIYSEKTKKIEEISLLVLFLLMSLICHSQEILGVRQRLNIKSGIFS